MNTITVVQPHTRMVFIPVRIVPLAARVQHRRARKAAYNEMRQAWALWRFAWKEMRVARLEYKLSKMQRNQYVKKENINRSLGSSDSNYIAIDRFGRV
jgi:U3 small nucleolar RNA-associated protein 14